MSDEIGSQMQKKHKSCAGNCQGAAGGLYGLGFIGAVVYYFQHADSFWVGVLGLLKAIVWPAMLAYKMLEFLKM